MWKSPSNHGSIEDKLHNIDKQLPTLERKVKDDARLAYHKLLDQLVDERNTVAERLDQLEDDHAPLMRADKLLGMST